MEQVERRLEDVGGETKMDKEERAKKGAVMMFLEHQMRMKKTYIEELYIVKMFSPAKEDWNTLYVEPAT